MPETEAPALLKDRIVDFRRIMAKDLQNNDGNWRTHPKAQVDAMSAVLKRVGIAGVLLVYNSPKRGGWTLIDGHMRKGYNPEQPWPCAILDVDDDEADFILGTHDPLALLVEMNFDKFEAIRSNQLEGCNELNRMALHAISVANLTKPPVDWGSDSDDWGDGTGGGDSTDPAQPTYKCPKCEHEWSGSPR